ncbi:MAG: transketolase family protein [Eubacteriales bacterium]
MNNTRLAFGEAILELANNGKDLFAISADNEGSMKLDLLKSQFPDRVINVGIAEQNMMMISAGIASTNKLVFAVSYAMLNSMRALEQLRTFIAYPKLNVKIISGLSGLTGGMEGVTHQCTEDIAIIRSIPNMVVVAPSDYHSTKVIIREISKYYGPVYVRIGRKDSPEIFNHEYTFKIGKANEITDGKDVCVISTGLITPRVYKAVKHLIKKGRSIQFLEMPTIKPIDKDAVINGAKKCEKIVTVEDHNIIGGLGGAVAETLSENYPIKIKRIGINDQFAESARYELLLDKYGLSMDTIISEIENMINIDK